MGILLAACAIAGMAVLVILFFKPYDYGASSRQSARLPLPKIDSGNDGDDTVGKLVKIRAGATACKCAAALQDRVYASREAPHLPLADCDRQDCHCYYLFTEDRRSGIDRRTSIDRLGRWLADLQQDRRHGYGRRVSDLQPIQV